MIKMICAMDEARGIGLDNQLLTRIPEDLQRFKECTMGHHVVMGRKTFESIGHPLPGRNNLVITSELSLKKMGVTVILRPDMILQLQKEHVNQDFFIIGGGEIFRWFLPFADELLLTLIHHRYPSDVTFPVFRREHFELTKQEEKTYFDGKQTIAFSFLDFKRKI